MDFINSAWFSEDSSAYSDNSSPNSDQSSPPLSAIETENVLDEVINEIFNLESQSVCHQPLPTISNAYQSAFDHIEFPGVQSFQEYQSMTTTESCESVPANSNINYDFLDDFSSLVSDQNNVTTIDFNSIDDLTQNGWLPLASDSNFLSNSPTDANGLLKFDLITSATNFATSNIFQNYNYDASYDASYGEPEGTSIVVPRIEKINDESYNNNFRNRQKHCKDCDKPFLNTGHLNRHFKTLSHQRAVLFNSRVQDLTQVQQPVDSEKPSAVLGRNAESSEMIIERQQQLDQKVENIEGTPCFNVQVYERDGNKIFVLESSTVSSSNKPDPHPSIPKVLPDLSEMAVEKNPKPKMQYYCEACNKTFQGINYLKAHFKYHHTTTRQYKCPKCGKLFGTELALNVHVAKHSAEKHYKCHLCPKSFVYKADLKRHKDGHNKVKLYPCNECYKSFSRKDHLLAHQKTHLKRHLKKQNGMPMNQLNLELN